MNRFGWGRQKALLLFLPFTWGCGASISAVYEGDVRFEHCMALDMRPEVAGRMRRECWVEWVAYYTYGQTRDRLLHAELRIQQLSSAQAAVEPAQPRVDAVGAPTNGAR